MAASGGPASPGPPRTAAEALAALGSAGRKAEITTRRPGSAGERARESAGQDRARDDRYRHGGLSRLLDGWQPRARAWARHASRAPARLPGCPARGAAEAAAAAAREALAGRLGPRRGALGSRELRPKCGASLADGAAGLCVPGQAGRGELGRQAGRLSFGVSARELRRLASGRQEEAALGLSLPAKPSRAPELPLERRVGGRGRVGPSAFAARESPRPSAASPGLSPGTRSLEEVVPSTWRLIRQRGRRGPALWSPWRKMQAVQLGLNRFL